ncbi:MAG TPA: glycosyltransferase [Solirubrobacteraceae bacterium]|nr:glycosyltransferase [Solirubrobacteraceae bacterium]
MADDRIPILYLAPWVDLGGSDKGTIDWFRHIDRERWAPSLITTQPSSNRWLHHVEPYADEVWDLPDLMVGCQFPAFVLGFIESRGVQVVHIMNSRLGFDLLPDMTCLPEPPVVVVQMHAEEPDRSGYVRYASTRYGNLIDAFSATSRQLKDAIAAYDIPASKVEVIYTGVDGADEFNPANVEPFSLPGNGTPRILWPGRLVEQKDPMLTLDVLAGVRERGADFVLDIVGDGHMAPAVRARAEELGLADAIQWHPASQEMARWYRSSDLLLMTSVFEGVPYVIYEALAMGVPVVAPALPGNLEFMDSDNGFLVEPRDDVGQYVDALATLLTNADRRRALGERSRQRMLEEFSLREMGRRHDELYDRLLNGRPASDRKRGAALAAAERPSPQPDAEAEPTPLRLVRDPAPERSVGVIVPCYRHGIFIDECIDSVKRQTLSPAAIVVVDDGSTDVETIDALARLDADPAVTVVRQATNSGPSAARNRALELLDTSYVLPLDADDQLLPDALERMVAQLEAAPPDIGFVYPNPQHLGNRDDYVQSPTYNLWLLTCNNYCPATSLFDRRVFEAGVAYPEEVVFGHEDWDLVLQLAGREVYGEVADGPTFLYRRHGFSRVNAVEYGPHSFHETIEHRHRDLYRRRDEIKARWAPALSILLLDEDDPWMGSDLADRPAQACADFELLARSALAPDVRVVGEDAVTSADWLQTAVAAARGRWVTVLGRDAAAALRRSSLVEHLIRTFWADRHTAAVVLADAPRIARAAFAQLDDAERLDARPVGITFALASETPQPKIELGSTDSLVTDLAMGLQTAGPSQWRLVPATSGGSATNGRATQPPGAREVKHVVLDREPAGHPAEAAVRRALAHQAPRLPELASGTVRRWEGAPTWIPPETSPLCRHRSLAGDSWQFTTSREPPDGYVLEFDLGCVHRFALPGTRRLVEHEGEFSMTDFQNELGDGRRGLGYVEQAPLPLLELLELRRMPGGGQHVLVAGMDDPLYDATEQVATLGWIEPLPINPRRLTLHNGAWGVETLRRHVDAVAWRHRYATGLPAGEADSVALGSLLPTGDPDRVELRRDAAGRLETDLARPSRASIDPRRAARWVVAPLAWSGGRAGIRTAGSRARRLGRGRLGRRRTRQEPNVLGWLRREPAPGFSPLFSATHPVTGDQFVTRSEIEATDLGYEIDGVLGYVGDAGASRRRADQPASILWGSRFGRGRRYVEGPRPGPDAP